MVCLLLGGCSQTTKVERAPGAAPPPTFLGPPFFRGSVGSMAVLLNYEPQYVSGYGLVVGLDDTGSSEVPPILRQTLINQMRKQGVGSIALAGEFPELARMSPERLLSRSDTAVVAIQGFIPPGAVKGSRFDVLVSAWPQTQTTSLAGGTLWTADLAPGQLENPREFLFKQAVARGPVYINPFDERYTDKPQQQFMRQALILKGGQVAESRAISLALNQPSWQRSRAIANRINERFGLATDRQLIATPETDRLIQLWIPPRWSSDPQRLLSMISVLYLQRGPGFEQAQAQRLSRELVKQPRYALQIVDAWRALGRTCVPELRKHYNSDNLTLGLASLKAGAYLADELASASLAKLAQDPDPRVRIAAARGLVHLPQSLTGGQALEGLLNDADRAVRLAAYESLARMGSRRVERTLMFDEQKNLKFAIDRVEAEKPLVYVTQRGVPRIVLFNKQVRFASPSVGRVWDNRLMVRVSDPQSLASVFYQPPHQANPQTYDNLVPTLASLIYLLSHHPTLEEPEPGLNLTYSQVVDAVYSLCQQRFIEAPLELNLAPLAKLIAEYEDGQDALDVRPEFVDPADRGEIEVEDPQVTTEEWTLEAPAPLAPSSEPVADEHAERSPQAPRRPELSPAR